MGDLLGSLGASDTLDLDQTGVWVGRSLSTLVAEVTTPTSCMLVLVFAGNIHKNWSVRLVGISSMAFLLLLVYRIVSCAWVGSEKLT